MIGTQAIFSSNTEEWETPVDFFDKLNAEFNFTLDPCASDQNYKCSKHYTKSDDGLSKNWSGETVFMNPPYGKNIYAWMNKAKCESSENGATIVCLVPARTDTKWFHDNVVGYADEIRFVKGRLKFGGSANSAPFPSMVVVYRGHKYVDSYQKFCTM